MMITWENSVDGISISVEPEGKGWRRVVLTAVGPPMSSKAARSALSGIRRQTTNLLPEPPDDEATARARELIAPHYPFGVTVTRGPRALPRQAYEDLVSAHCILKQSRRRPIADIVTIMGVSRHTASDRVQAAYRAVGCAPTTPISRSWGTVTLPSPR